MQTSGKRVPRSRNGIASSPTTQIVPPEKVLRLPHDQLANEMWVQIFECLPSYPPPELYHYRSDPIEEYPIQRMSRTCKRMRTIALPFMFSDIYLTTPMSVVNTLERMILHPRLALHVRRLDIYVQALTDFSAFVRPDGPETVARAQRGLASKIFCIASVLSQCSPIATTNYYGAIPEALAHDMLTQLFPTFIKAKTISFERDLRRSINHDRTTWADAQSVQNILSHCYAVEHLRLSLLDATTFTKAYAFHNSLRTLYLDRVRLSPDIYAVWLSQLTSLKHLHISEPYWAGADFTSLIEVFGKFGPYLESLVIREYYMNTEFPEGDYFSWATATTEMVKCCSTLTTLVLRGVCYRANIVRDLPKSLVSLTMGQMHFGAGQRETISYREFVDGLTKLPNLKTLDINHNFININMKAAAILKKRGVQKVFFSRWQLGADTSQYDEYGDESDDFGENSDDYDNSDHGVGLDDDSDEGDSDEVDE
ncbi:hypothetical protein BD410DRAFT_840127 [Rickenella mellea]|uniref:F-box domain-containing protein n=1 Tax=Rickenella mellea TaxID=50990 RepID=A0A4Y7Q2Y0_9AGAM|nr:hypothetical protein BD410DRAFT_840127 [Rickenella mellea]